MNYEVRKVANGYVVVPGREFNRDNTFFEINAMHVFPTWAKASAWLRKQFEPKQP